MSAQEFVQWIAFLRQNPAPTGRWLNLQFAELKREISKGHAREKGAKLPPLDAFLWKPLEPLFIRREKRKAKARREAKARKAGGHE